MTGCQIALNAKTVLNNFLEGQESSLFSINQERITPFSLCLKHFYPTGSNQGGVLHFQITNPTDLMWTTFAAQERPPLTTPSSEDNLVKDCNVLTYWANAFGYVQIPEVELQISSTNISKMYGTGALLYRDLLLPAGRRLEEMIGMRFTTLQLMDDSHKNTTLFTPILGFWSSGSPAYALRCVAMGLATITVIIHVRQTAQLAFSNQVRCIGNNRLESVQPELVGGTTATITLVVFMFWLGMRERLRLAAKVEELVVKGWQLNPSNQTYDADFNSSSVRVDLNFGLPVMYFSVIAQNQALVQCAFPNFINFAGPNGVDPILAMFVELGNENYTDPMPGVFWRVVVPWTFFEHIPELWQYVISFAVDPYSEKYTGSFNMVPIDKVYLNVVLAGSPTPGERLHYNIFVYATVWFVIRYGGQTLQAVFK